MSGTRKVAGLAIVAALCLILGNAMSAAAQAPAAAGQDPGAGKQPYTMPEYNSYQACASEKVPATQVKCLDDFVSKYPNSALLIYVYPLCPGVRTVEELTEGDRVFGQGSRTGR